MASRAELRPRPGASTTGRAPGLGAAIRAALSDGYYHSWRLVPANVVWAMTAIAIAAVGIVTPLAIALVPLLALPTAGVFRVTTRIVRGEAVSFWDAVDAWRTDVGRTLGVGLAFLLAAAVLGTNTILGLGSDSPVGWATATLAAWGLLVGWLLAWTAWPIVVDPARADQPLRARLRLAALLVLAHPVRIGVLGIVLAAFLVLSAIAIVALVTVSFSFAALVATREILPAADRLETELAAAGRGTEA